MTQETRFSRIAVTADDDDDFVIEAGAPQSFAQEPAVAAIAPDLASAAESDPVVEFEPAQSPEPAPVVSALEEKPAPQLKSESSSARNSADAYETTLEDLDSVSMSGVQKAVIAIAVLAVIAFVASQFLV